MPMHSWSRYVWKDPSIHACVLLNVRLFHLGCSLKVADRWQSRWVWFRTDNVWLYGVNITLHSFTCFIFIFWPCLETNCSSFVQCYKSTPLVVSTWPCSKLKLDEEKSKRAGLAQQNCFGPAFLHS
jgi:hypothetical protein